MWARAGNEATPTGHALRLDLAFTPWPIPRGHVVRTEVYVGCTGARAKVASEGEGEFDDWTRGPRKAAIFETEETTGRERKVQKSPSLGTCASTKRGFKVDGEEYELRDTCTGNAVWWTLARRDVRAVAGDVLEGNLLLNAHLRTTEPDGPVWWEACPTDVRIFGPDRRVLPRLTTAALRVALFAKGVRLPKQEPRKFDALRDTS